ncbi:WxcM-like domain-containing protein [Marixanthomonas ophiurae]|uniref:WxcM-like domain-containing protein n=1 Tax=Marixanthomonas ophiurae TaxID=387659 RepID=UPI0013140D04|nr:WxcM-like domain-containing protein [Marixanthomonas ophiurae]
MLQPKIIQGGSHIDERGTLQFLNDFDMKQVKRLYQTTNATTSMVRAWMAHKIESRWFFCAEGKFTVKLVRVLDFEKGLASNEIITYKLDSDNPQILYIPPGYASGFKTEVSNSKLLIFADYAFGEIEDNFKFTTTDFLPWQS